ncbi:MAG: carbohydrate kinase family protein [Erysipelotrichales bacterium]|nr:carbohydrate kinase family protein [Erysipelotrichales bacterium]
MIYIVGGANMDIYGKSNSHLRSHDSNIGKVRMAHGGVGRNITESLARLSCPVEFQSAFGNDEFAKVLLNRLRELHIGLSNSLHFPQESTSIYLAVLDEQGDMNIAICDNDVIHRLTPQDVIDFVSKASSDDILVMDTNLREELIIAAIENSKAKIFIDPLSQEKALKIKEHLHSIYALKPNVYEAEVLYGKEIKTQADLYQAGTFFMEQGIKHLYISLGENGMYYRSPTQSKWIKTPRQPMVNASGAGDACMAGIIYGHSHALCVEEIVELAMSNAVLALRSEDTVPSDLCEETLKKTRETLVFEWRNIEC